MHCTRNMIGVTLAHQLVQFSHQSRRGLFLGRRHIPICDLHNQTVVLADGARKSAWMKDRELVKVPIEGCSTTYHAIRHGLKTGGKEMLGMRVFDEQNGLVWKWVTYEEAIKRSDHISQAIREIGIPIGDTSRIGIYSRNRPEWILCDMAAHNFSNCTVPIYDTASVEDFVYITNLTELSLIFVDTEEKARMIIENCTKMKCVKNLVIFNEPSEEIQSMARNAKLEIWSFERFEKMGKIVNQRVEHRIPTPDTMASISFTSGTTGRPKGAILRHSNICSILGTIHEFEFGAHEKDSYISYLPLAHIYERVFSIIAFVRGIRIGFTRGEPHQILDDTKSLAPFAMATVPRIIDKIHKGVMRQLRDKPIRRFLVNAAITYKNWHFEQTGVATRDTLVDKLVLSDIQSILGANLKQIVVGAAKPDPHTMRFMRGAFGIQIFEAYGQTETSGPATFTIRGQRHLGVVGVPVECVQIKLVDAPELGYMVADNGGEIALKGFNITEGYFRNAVATRDAHTADGYFKTGDIGRFTSEGTLEIIDRKKNVFKLPQGKFVAPDEIESQYSTSRFVGQIYVHGEPTKPWLVAVISPDPQYLSNYAHQVYGLKGKSLEELCDDERIVKDICRRMAEITLEHQRPRYEGVYAVHLTPIVFTPHNDLTTPTMKNKRVKLATFFRKEIDQMYARLEKSEIGV